MTDEEYRQNLRDIENWANDQVRIIEHRAARPPNYAKNPAAYNSHRRIYADWKQQIERVEETMYFLNDALDAVFYKQELPAPANKEQAAELSRFLPRWQHQSEREE